MAELADALDSGSNDRKVMEVQVLLPAPNLRSAIRNELPAVFLLCCSAASGYLFCNPNPNRRGLCIVRDDFFEKASAHARRRSCFLQKVTLGLPAWLQRLAVVTNFLRDT